MVVVAEAPKAIEDVGEAVIVTVPAFTKGRSRLTDPLIVNVFPVATVVVPEPLWVPAVQVPVSLIETAPVPFRVPPVWEKAPVDAAPLKVAVPALSVVVDAA